MPEVVLGTAKEQKEPAKWARGKKSREWVLQKLVKARRGQLLQMLPRGIMRCRQKCNVWIWQLVFTGNSNKRVLEE